MYNYRHTTACSQIYITGTAPMATYDDARTATDELVRKIEVSISVTTLAYNPAPRAYKFSTLPHPPWPALVWGRGLGRGGGGGGGGGGIRGSVCMQVTNERNPWQRFMQGKLEEWTGITPHCIIKGGSLGHGTAVPGEFDLDLVIYTNGTFQSNIYGSCNMYTPQTSTNNAWRLWAFDHSANG